MAAPHRHHSPWDNFWRIVSLEGRDIVSVCVFGTAAAALTLLMPLGVEQLINVVQFGGAYQPLVVLSALLFAAFLFLAAFQGLQYWVVEAMQQRLFARLALRIADRIPRLARNQMESDHPPEVLNRFFEIATAQKACATLLLDGLTLTLNLLVGMAVLASYHPILLQFDLALMGTLALILFAFGKAGVRTAIAESHAKYAVAAWLEETARPTFGYKSADVADHARTQADSLVGEYLRSRNRHFKVWFRQMALALLLQAVASTGLLALGGWLVSTGGLTVGQLVAAYLIVSVVVNSFAKFGKHLLSLYDLVAAADKLCHLLDLPQERTGTLAPPTGPAFAVGARGLRLSAQGRDLCGPLDFDVPAGSCCTVMAAPGAGGSALLESIYGLLAPTAGRLEVGSYDLRELDLAEYRSRVGWAGTPEIAHASILDNVTMGRRSVSAEDALAALEEVELLDAVRRLPDGHETILLPTGRPLSDTQGAQLQLARAIAGRPALLLIDGLLDRLGPALGERLATKLLAGHHGWTVLMATKTPTIAACCRTVLRLVPPTGGPRP